MPVWLDVKHSLFRMPENLTLGEHVTPNFRDGMLPEKRDRIITLSVPFPNKITPAFVIHMKDAIKIKRMSGGKNTKRGR